MITLGPQQTPEEAARALELTRQLQSAITSMPMTQLCNCIGPQPGETKCPCQLRAEIQKGQQMIAEGVVIAGRRYRLVPDDSSS